MDPNFIILISFIVFMALAFRYGYKKSIAALDGQIDEIRNKLEDATRQKQEALSLLAEERQSHSETFNLAENLENQSQEKLLELKKSLMHDLEQLVRKKEHDLQDLMKRFTQDAILNIQEEVAEVTQKVVRRYSETVLTERDHEKINDIAIDEITITLAIANGNSQDSSQTSLGKKTKADLGVVKW